MANTCRPFYSMQKILNSRMDIDFHRKFGNLTNNAHGVYIWGFAKVLKEEGDKAEQRTEENVLSAFEVNVEMENIAIYYVGKAESINVFERIMQERANLFGGFFPIFEFDHYFDPTPFLITWNQMCDLQNQKTAHQSRLKQYTSCKCAPQTPFSRAQNPVLYSNAYFNRNDLVDQLLNPNTNSSSLLNFSVNEMSKNFIFTWIDCEPNGKVSEVENLLHDVLGVNVLGVGGVKRIGAIDPSSLKINIPLNTIHNNSVSIDFSKNMELLHRISNIHNESVKLINQCRCFKV